MKETPFKEKVEEWLESMGAWFIKYWAGPKGFTKEGIPDILACINGKFYGMELKGDGGKPTLLQIINLRKIRAAGGIGVLLYPDDLKYFIEFINGTEMGDHWYRENKQRQQDWFDKLSACI